MNQQPIFISYSHKDEAEKEALLSHLRVLRRAGLVDLWSDVRIRAGAYTDQEVAQAIDRAYVAVLLISANFLNSAEIWEKQIARIRERHRKKALIVLPMIARACAWKRHRWLKKMSVRPREGHPVWRDGGIHADEELADIAGEIAKLVKKAYEPQFQIETDEKLVADDIGPVVPEVKIDEIEPQGDRLKPGTLIFEGYEIKKFIAEGKQGQVYLAHHNIFGNQIIKRLRPHIADEPKYIERFQREAQITDKLQQLSAKAIFIRDFRQDPYHNYEWFCVMDYASEGSLRDKLALNAPLSVAEALDIALNLCQALSPIHKYGYIHGDLKPGNILFHQPAAQTELTLKLADFGSAFQLDNQDKHLFPPSCLARRHTMMYVAPELLAASDLEKQTTFLENIDQRADIYSIGVILYEMLTGQPPFWGQLGNESDSTLIEVKQQLWKRILTEQPSSPSDKVPEIWNSLDKIVMSLLAKEPEQRYENLESLIADLQRERETVNDRLRELSHQIYGYINNGTWEQAKAPIDEAMMLDPNYGEIQDYEREIDAQLQINALLGEIRNAADTENWGEVRKLTIRCNTLDAKGRRTEELTQWIDKAKFELEKKADLAKVDRLISEGKNARAVEILRSLRARSPDDKDLKEKLARLELQRNKEKLYQEAKRLMSEKQWITAINVLEELTLLDTRYEDAASLLVAAQRHRRELEEQQAKTEHQQTLENLLKACDTAVQEEDWSKALEKLQEIGFEKNYRDVLSKDDVLTRLFYVEGRICTKNEQWYIARRYFERVMERTPDYRDVQECLKQVNTNNLLRRYYGNLEILSDSGVSRVETARRLSDQRAVILKYLAPSHLKHQDNNTAISRAFRRQAQRCLILNHPNIVKILSVEMRILDENDLLPQPIVVMDYIEGQNLARFSETQSGGISEKEVITFGKQMCEALDDAHSKGILHLDIKPPNILLQPDGHLKLTDFGHSPRGTQGYAAPEQSKDSERQPDERTDIYAIGKVLYVTLTGKSPFESANDESVIPILQESINKATAQDPEQRYQTARELLEALKEAEAELPGTIQRNFQRFLRPFQGWFRGRPTEPDLKARSQPSSETPQVVEEERTESTSWFLSLTSSSRVVKVGDKIQVSIKLSSHSNNQEELIVTNPDNEILIQLTAEGLSLQSDRVLSFMLSADQKETMGKEVELIALRRGTFDLVASVIDAPGVSQNARINIVVRPPKTDKWVELLPSPVGPRPGRQPDLTMRVYVTPPDDPYSDYRFQYVGYSPLSRLGLAGYPFGSVNINAATLNQLRVELAHIVRSTPNATPLSLKTRLSVLGKRLYTILFPEELQRLCYNEFAAQVKSWLILCDMDPWIPWELVKPFRDQREEDFLGMRFALVRTIEGLGTPHQYEFPLGPVNLTLDERLEPHYQSSEWEGLFSCRQASPLLQAYSAGYLALMQYTSPVWGQHFVGVPDRLARSSGILSVAVNQLSLSEKNIRAATLDFWAKRPLITFGMVNLMGQSCLTQMEQQWVPTFIKTGIGTFVGSLWTTTPRVDRLFWRIFYRAIWSRRTLGEAVLAARRAVQQALPDSLDHLAYFAVGDPMARGYLPKPGEGYAWVECQSHDLSRPLQLNQSYLFSARVKHTPPTTYHGRRYKTEPGLIQAPHLQIFAPEFDIQPGTNLALEKREQYFEQSFRLCPRRSGQHDLFFKFYENEDLLQTIDLTVEVERDPL